MKNITLITMACLLAAPMVFADAPAWIPVQAYLTDSDGNPLSGEHEITLSIYETNTSGSALFSEVQTSIVENGLVTLYMGQTQSLELSMFRNTDELYLGIEVDSDGEMSPRFTLGSVPYAGFAQYAGDANTLQGYSPTDFRSSSNPVDWSDLGGVPAGIGDGDNDTLADISCSQGQVAKFSSGSWQCGDDISNAPHTHPGTDITSPVASALSANTANTASSVPWTGISGVPAGFADGVDNVGSGLGGSGTANTLAMFSAADSVTDSVITQDGTNIGIGKTPDASNKLDVSGTVGAANFRTSYGSMSVEYNQTGTATLAFGGRSIYIVKASWGGHNIEGTRAWYVLTQNDINHFTGHPTIIEIGMSTGNYHHSDTLTLTEDDSLNWNELKLSATKSAPGDASTCRWAISRISFY